jgi:hypothetical protein
MKVSGTFAEGKMFRGNSRWAKVMVCKFTTRPSWISVAYGHEGDLEAFKVVRYGLNEVKQSRVKGMATDWIDAGYAE